MTDQIGFTWATPEVDDDLNSLIPERYRLRKCRFTHVDHYLEVDGKTLSIEQKKKVQDFLGRDGNYLKYGQVSGMAQQALNSPCHLAILWAREQGKACIITQDSAEAAFCDMNLVQLARVIEDHFSATSMFKRAYRLPVSIY